MTTTAQTFDLNVYDQLLHYIDGVLPFEGFTLKQWSEKLTLPPIPEYIEIADLNVLHTTAHQFSETIFANLALAKARLIGAKASLNKKLNVTEYNIRDEINKSPTKKLPASSVIENRAFNASLSEMQAQTVCEIFAEYWKTQAQKLESFNSRLTTLSYTVNQENRLSTYGNN